MVSLKQDDSDTVNDNYITTLVDNDVFDHKWLIMIIYAFCKAVSHNHT